MLNLSQNKSNRLDRLESLVQANTEAINRLEKQQEKSQQWNDRTWDVIKFVSVATITVSISTLIAWINVLGKLG